jgi:hypothetical protein
MSKITKDNLEDPIDDNAPTETHINAPTENHINAPNISNIPADSLSISRSNIIDNIKLGNIEKFASSIAPLILQNSQTIINPPKFSTTKNHEHVSQTDHNTILSSIMCKVLKQRQLHRMSVKYYERYNSLINIPAIAISGAATVYSFAYPSDGQQGQIFINKIIAGSLSAINTILYSLGCFFKLQAKSESHFIAAEEYDNLITMIHFELRFPNENIQEFANKVEKKILEIKKSCRYFPPEKIINEYDKTSILKESNIV